MHHVKHLTAVIVFSMMSACCHTPYLTAAGNFGSTMSNSSTELQGLTGLASDLCQERAQLDYVFHRLNQDPHAGAVPRWPSDLSYEVPQSDGTTRTSTWGKHCEQIALADAVVTKALTLLAQYGKALNDLSGGDYSGKNVTGIVTDVGSDLTTLKTAPSKVTDTLTALAGPLGDIAGMLEKEYAEGQVKAAVKNADPGVKAALAAIINYELGVGAEVADAQHLMKNALEEADKKLPANSMEILRFSDLERKWVSDLATQQQQQGDIGATLGDLQKAEASLVTAGHKDTGSDEFKSLLKSVAGLAVSAQSSANSASNAKSNLRR
jgi:hypothetical protein